MKKIFSLGLAALALLAVSCVKEENAPVEKPEVNANGKYTIVAEMEQSVQTRTTVEQEGTTNQYKVKWAEGDKISVFAGMMGMDNKEFTLTKGAGATSGTFTGDLADPSTMKFALYPYNADHSIMGNYILPSVYGDVNTEYTPNTNAYMMANLVASPQEEGSTPTLSFYHLGGVLVLDLYGIPANVKGVVLTANKGITGEVSFMDELMDGVTIDGLPALYPTESNGTNNSITINFKPKATVRNEIFYFPLPVGTYQFMVEYIDADDNKIPVIDSKKDNEIKRAGLKTMPELEVAPLAKISFSDKELANAKISIDVVDGYEGDFVYYIHLLGNTSNWQPERLEQAIQSDINSASSSKNYFSDGKYEAAGGSFLAWYQAYMGSKTYTFAQSGSVFVALVPVLDKSNPEEPVLDMDHMIYEVVTFNGYTINNNTDAEVTIDYDSAAQTPTKVYATITPKEGTSFRYTSNPLTQSAYDAIKDDDAAMLKKVGTTVKTDAFDFSYSCTPNQTYYLLVYAFDSKTGEGKIQVQKLESPEVTYNEGIKMNLEVLHAGFRYADVKIEATGGELKQIRWGYMKKSAFESNATLKANGTELDKMMEIAEEQLSINKVIAKMGLITAANFTSDNLYSIENMYYEEDTYLFVIGYDNDDVPTRMDYELIDINESDPLENFDASLDEPDVRNVYYYGGTASVASNAYKQPFENWINMNTVTDVSTLDALYGMYWLDLDWGVAGAPKRMWLSMHDDLNNPAKALITGDAKHDALEVLKLRSGKTTSGTAPDFYGRDSKTGALSLTDVEMFGTTEAKTLRNKNTTPYSSKTLFLVWETTDGKYGYTTVVAEDYLPKPTVYLKPNGLWTDANARFAAYFFDDAANKNTWLDMTDANEDGIYEVIIPEDVAYPSVIFCRMDPEKTVNDWGAKWNQTVDLAVTADKCYALDAETRYGTWMTKEEAVAYAPGKSVYLNPRYWDVDGARFVAKFYGADLEAVWLNMTAVEGTGVYKVALPEGVYDKLMFYRMDPSKPDNNDDSKWNATGELTVPTDPAVLFELPDNSWDGATSGWRWDM